MRLLTIMVCCQNFLKIRQDTCKGFLKLLENLIHITKKLLKLVTNFFLHFEKFGKEAITVKLMSSHSNKRTKKDQVNLVDQGGPTK